MARSGIRSGPLLRRSAASHGDRGRTVSPKRFRRHLQQAFGRHRPGRDVHVVSIVSLEHRGHQALPERTYGLFPGVAGEDRDHALNPVAQSVVGIEPGDARRLQRANRIPAFSRRAIGRGHLSKPADIPPSGDRIEGRTVHIGELGQKRRLVPSGQISVRATLRRNSANLGNPAQIEVHRLLRLLQGIPREFGSPRQSAGPNIIAKRS